MRISTITLFVFLVASCRLEAQWKTISYPFQPEGANMNGFAMQGDTLYTAANRHDIYMSTDDGDSWNAIPTLYTGDLDDEERIYYHLIADRGKLYTSIPYFDIYRFDGLNWVQLKTIGKRVRYNRMPMSISKGYIFYGIEGSTQDNQRGIYRRRVDDDTSLWTLSSYKGPGLSWLKADGDLVLAGAEGSIYRSNDAGETWTENHIGEHINNITIVGRVALFGTYQSGIYRSTDSGLTWTRLSGSVGTGQISSIAASGATVVASVFSRGVFLSQDTGLTWTTINEGLTDSTVVSPLFISDRYIFGSGMKTVLRRRLSDFAGPAAVDEPLIHAQALSASLSIFPNPASSDLSIQIDASRAATAQVRVLTLLGSAVGEKMVVHVSPGENLLRWRATQELVPGLYVCIVSVEGHVLTQTVVISRN